MRPRNIVRFEWTAYSALLLPWVSAALNPERIEKSVHAGGLGFFAVVIVVFYTLYIALIWLAAHRRKNWARWVYSAQVLFLPRYVYLIPRFPGANALTAAIDITTTILVLISVWFLFTGGAKGWFKRDPGGEGADETPLPKGEGQG